MHRYVRASAGALALCLIPLSHGASQSSWLFGGSPPPAVPPSKAVSNCPSGCRCWESKNGQGLIKFDISKQHLLNWASGSQTIKNCRQNKSKIESLNMQNVRWAVYGDAFDRVSTELIISKICASPQKFAGKFFMTWVEGGEVHSATRGSTKWPQCWHRAK